MSGFFRTPTREEIIRSIPRDWIYIPPHEISPSTYVAIADWIVREEVYERGVANLREIALNTGLLPTRMTWELWRDGLKKVPDVTSQGKVTYVLELYMASAEDVLMLQMRFL